MKTFSLSDVRADDWFGQLGAGSPGFDQLCEVVGRRFVAFSAILGVRITALTVDSRNLEASVVEVQIGESRSAQRVSLGELRERLAEALSDDDDPPSEPLGDDPTSEALQLHIGFRYLLLAPVFNVQLEALRVDGLDAVVLALFDGERAELPLEALREELRRRVRAEAVAHRGGGSSSRVAIDLNLVPAAREAADAGDDEKVVQALGAWPGPLSVLLRSADGQGLAPEARAGIAEAMGLLGTAHVRLGRHEWGQEVLRLGIQWAQDQSEPSADLFARLGAALLAEERHAEAIGPLRRALGLGARRSLVLPQLARCFLARGRMLPALLCVEDALAAGAPVDAVRPIREAALSALGDEWRRFRGRVPPTSAIG
jgi:hypothetical protein